MALPALLIRDFPFTFISTGNTQGGSEHVFLADCEGIDVDVLVSVVLEACIGTARLDGQAEDCSHCTADLSVLASNRAAAVGFYLRSG